MKFMMIVPQKARGKFQPWMEKDPGWIKDIKYDGERRIVQVFARYARFTGTPSKKSGKPVEKTEQVPHLSGRKPPLALHVTRKIPDTVPPSALEGTVLDGEIITRRLDLKGGGRSKYVTSIMNSSPEEAIRKQIEEGWLHYKVFDCLFYKGEDVRHRILIERRTFAAKAVAEWGNEFVSFASAAKSFAAALEAGEEGVIYKNIGHRYGDANGWVKRKGQWTADVVIMGFKAAKELSKKKGDDAATMTKYAKAGLIGAVVVGQYPDLGRESLVEVATISGMDDDLRRTFSFKPEVFVGRVVRIKHNGREPTGRFRHPRWDDFRTDKRPADCVMIMEEM